MTQPNEIDPDQTEGAADDSAFMERVMRYIDDDLSETDLAQFESELIESADKRRTLALVCLSDSLSYEEITRHGADLLEDEIDSRPVSMHESMEMPALAYDAESEARAVVLPPHPIPLPAAAPRFSRPWWIGLAAAIVLTVLGLFYFAMGHKPTVATVTANLGAFWEGPAHLPGSNLSADDSLFLRQGFCKLLFQDGTEIVVEAPSRITIKSGSALHLDQGTISARVTSGLGGFVVTTPTAIVTDLGTEFGVKFDPNAGSCQIDVFKGKVRVAPGSVDSTIYKTELSANQSAQVTGGMITLNPAGARPQDFVRNIQESGSSLDLADLVSGGDGTSRRSGIAIEPGTGETGNLGPALFHEGDGEYHRINSIPVLDGCFIPEGGETKVDSAGHTVFFERRYKWNVRPHFCRRRHSGAGWRVHRF